MPLLIVSPANPPLSVCVDVRTMHLPRRTIDTGNASRLLAMLLDGGLGEQRTGYCC